MRLVALMSALAITACAWSQGSPASPVSDLRRLESATGKDLEKACAQVAQDQKSWEGEKKAIEMATVLDAAYLRAKVRDRFTLARLMAFLGDEYGDGYPFLITCGEGRYRTLWSAMQASLEKALKQNPEFVARLLRDQSPSIVTATIECSGKEHNQTIRNALLTWTRSPNPRFRILPAFFNRVLPMSERVLVIERSLEDPDPFIRREAVSFVNVQTAIEVLAKLRQDFANASSGRKVGVLYLGCRLSEPSISRELAIARKDPDPNVRKAAEEFGRNLDKANGS